MVIDAEKFVANLRKLESAMALDAQLSDGSTTSVINNLVINMLVEFVDSLCNVVEDSHL